MALPSQWKGPGHRAITSWSSAQFMSPTTRGKAVRVARAARPYPSTRCVRSYRSRSSCCSISSIASSARLTSEKGVRNCSARSRAWRTTSPVIRKEAICSVRFRLMSLRGGTAREELTRSK